MRREVVVRGLLNLGPGEQIFYGEFDGERPRRVLIKIIRRGIMSSKIVGIILGILLFIPGRSYIFAQNKAYIEGGKIIVENEKGEKKLIDYTHNQFIAVSPSKKWAIKKTQVQGAPSGYETILITNTSDSSQNIVVRYPINGENQEAEGFAFGPQEDVVFYTLPCGDNFQVYEVNLTSKTRTLVTTAGSADIISCQNLSQPQKYILIKDYLPQQKQKVYYLYSPQSGEIKSFDSYQELEFFKEHYCQN